MLKFYSTGTSRSQILLRTFAQKHYSSWSAPLQSHFLPPCSQTSHARQQIPIHMNVTHFSRWNTLLRIRPVLSSCQWSGYKNCRQGYNSYVTPSPVYTTLGGPQRKQCSIYRTSRSFWNMSCVMSPDCVPPVARPFYNALHDEARVPRDSIRNRVPRDIHTVRTYDRAALRSSPAGRNDQAVIWRGSSCKIPDGGKTVAQDCTLRKSEDPTAQLSH